LDMKQEPADEVLIEEYRSGDGPAFERFLDRHKDGLYAYVRRLAGGGQRADDVFQETLYRFIRRIRRRRLRGNIRAYLFRTARNIVYDETKAGRDSRGKRREVTSVEPWMRATEIGPHEEAAERELKRRLDEALAELPQEKREAFVLNRYSGLSFEEVARVQGCSLSAAKMRVFRTLDYLADRLERLTGEREKMREDH